MYLVVLKILHGSSGLGYFSWKGELSTGFVLFDRHHKKIIDLGNMLHEAVRYRDPDLSSEAMRLLLEYAQAQFVFEEKVLEKCSYPYLPEHRAVHQRFLKKLTSYCERRDVSDEAARKLLSELRLWVDNHVHRDDQHYMPMVRKCIRKSWWTRFRCRVLSAVGIISGRCLGLTNV